MDSAKGAVKSFLGKAGHNDTTVEEKVAPAVTQETQNFHHHEDVQTAVDKEVHQDHYHTSVQPVFDKEVKPEQHHHNLAAVEHRNFEHGNDREVAEKLRLEQAKYQDEIIAGETKHTQSVKPTVGGEHVHHHVHETIQPVVQREVIEPHVTHTVVPIHEVHHNAASHHAASALPAVSMAEFKKAGGTLTGREERYDGFEGEPKSMMGKVESAVEGHHHHHGTGATGSGVTGSGVTGSNTTGTTGI